MFKVYKITNLKNKMIYIGQTSQEVSVRLKEHFYSRREKGRVFNLPLRVAMREFDSLDFWKIEILPWPSSDHIFFAPFSWSPSLKNPPFSRHL